ncbi:MAG: hypothetical protein Q7V57_15545 [Actinomycetota bacterium]|nr:hypothetical protein [Actinomycetota bacterium]
MNRLLTATLVAVSLVGFAACGSDGDSKLTDVGNGDQTDESSGDGSDSGSIPNLAGVPEQCQAIVQAMSGAAAALSGQSDTDQAKAVFAALETVVPDDLKDDARIFAEAYGGYIELLAKFEGDSGSAMSDPEVLAAIAALGSEEVSAAADNISAYMDSACPD